MLVGASAQPSSLYLDGLGALTLGSVSAGAVAPVDVTARGDLTVAGNVSTFGSVSLAADVQPGGTGDDGVGTLTIGAGVTVTGAGVTGEVEGSVTKSPAPTPAKKPVVGKLKVRFRVVAVDRPKRKAHFLRRDMALRIHD